MSKVIAVTNQKGGVGKTTTSVNLSAALAYMGKKVLLIDIDPQANATQGLGVDRASLEYTIYDAIAQQMPIQDISIPSGVDNLDIVPANIDLAGVEIELSQVKSGREQRLKSALGDYKNQYDYVIIDCPPALGLLNTNALTAADSVLIPVQCEYYALEGLSQLIHTIELVQERLNPSLEIEGVVFLANPDMLSGLTTWAFYDNNAADCVVSTFGSGCSAVVTQATIENRKGGKRTFLGFFDPSVRPHFEADKLSYTIPMSRFKEMYETMRQSCLFDTHAWGKIKERMNG